MQRQRLVRDHFMPVLMLLALLAGWLLVAGDHYLLFHSLVELFTAAICLVIFSIAWHTRRHASSDYLTFIGMWAFTNAWITVMHALTYKGIQVLPEYDANLPTQLWVIARSLQVSAFIIAPVFLVRPLKRPGLVLSLYAGAASVLVWLALAGLFPAAFVEGQGLTTFKIAAEYSVMYSTILAAMILAWSYKHLERSTLSYLLVSMGAMVAAEFAFTLYSDPTGIANRIGHIAYFTAFLLIYVALVRTSLEDPYRTLFRQLKESERQLAAAYAAEHDIAETLQNAMAVQPKEAPGIAVSHRYLPARGIGRIGGDFYDIFPLVGTRVGIAIGDVCGKGLKAAGTTLKARTALRAMAFEHAEPAEVLERVNTYLYRELEDDSFVTAAYGTFDTATGVLRMAVAGHPDPLVCGRDRQPLGDERTQPLGVLDRLEARSTEVRLEPGESIVLVTDGLIDAPGHEGRFGIGRLASLVGRLHCGQSSGEVLDEVIRALGAHATGEIDDDVAIVVVQWTPEANRAYGT